MTDDLVRFLRDRLDAEEHVARAASPGPWHINAEADEVLAADGITVADGFALSSQQLRATTEHIARHDPARVLREVEAKRRIVDDYHYESTLPDGTALNECGTCGAANDPWPCPTLRLLALPYSGHADYREDWRP
ncbi:DUF6221 family protein [Streptomyces sp. NPDC056227]|uniref:DUF6221 family protein n=1 Tax=Streptomyces sp. NPDC056227 TaxID=3345753 RepID=UPI0035DBD4D6